MDRAWIAPAALAAGLVAGCGGDAGRGDAPRPGGGDERPVGQPDRRGLAVDAPRTVTTRGGEYEVSWMPVGGFVPENEPFEATVTVRTPAGDPVTGARVAMDCRMPDHGHGMLRVPRSEEREGGEYVVRGLLLHMGGFWTVTITVVGDGGVAATADDEVTL